MTVERRGISAAGVLAVSSYSLATADHYRPHEFWHESAENYSVGSSEFMDIPNGYGRWLRWSHRIVRRGNGRLQ